MNTPTIDINSTQEEILAAYEQYKVIAKNLIDQMDAGGLDRKELAERRNTYVQVCVAIDDVKGLGNITILRSAVVVMEKYVSVLEFGLMKLKTKPMSTVTIEGETYGVSPILNRNPDLERGKDVSITMHPVTKPENTTEVDPFDSPFFQRNNNDIKE